MNNTMQKLLSTAMAAAIVATSPGTGAYEASARMMSGRGMAPAPMRVAPVTGMQNLGRSALPNAALGGLQRFDAIQRSNLQAAPALRQELAAEQLAPLAAESKGVTQVLGRVGSIAKAAPGAAKGTGFELQAIIEGGKLAETGNLVAPDRAAFGSLLQSGKSLQGKRTLGINRVSSPEGNAPKGNPLSGIFGLFATVARMGLGAAVFVGVSEGLPLLLPALFASVPAATVWAGSVVAVMALPALYARYRLSRYDNANFPRARGPKQIIDVALGIAAATLYTALPLIDAETFAAAVAAVQSLTDPATALGAIDAGALLGISAAAMLASSALFLPMITNSIKSGDSYRAPQQFMPAFYWLMAGAVAALVGGFTGTGMYTNIGIAAWMFLRNSKLFQALYGGLAAYVIAVAVGVPAMIGMAVGGVGIAYAAFQYMRTRQIALVPLMAAAAGLGIFLAGPFSGSFGPIGLLLIAFTPGQAMSLYHWMMGKSLPVGHASTNLEAERTDWVDKTVAAIFWIPNKLQTAFPNVFLWGKTAFAFALMAGLAAAAVSYIFPFMTFLSSLGMASLMGFGTYWFSHKLVVKMMQGVPIEQDPTIEQRVMPMLKRIAADKGVPVPTTYIIPTMMPNAFATGRSPKVAVVGVTVGILGLLNDEELEGVLAHEMSHITHRDMLMNAVLGSVSSGISFASYGVMWAVSAAGSALASIFGGFMPKRFRKAEAEADKVVINATPNGLPKGNHRQMADPVTVGAALTSLPALFKIMAALNAPLMAQLVQMFSSRTRESHADVGAFGITGKAEPLATALLKLSGWRPTMMFLAEPIAAKAGPNAGIAERMRVWWTNQVAKFRKGAAETTMFALGAQMIINPGTQVTPDFVHGKMTRAILGDDFLFNLFVTHPPVPKRVADLRALDKAHGGKK